LIELSIDSSIQLLIHRIYKSPALKDSKEMTDRL